MSDKQIAQWCFVIFLMYILAAMAQATMTILVMILHDMYERKEVTD